MSEGFGWILGWWDRQERTWRRTVPRYRTWSTRNFSVMVECQEQIVTHLRLSKKVPKSGLSQGPARRSCSCNLKLEGQDQACFSHTNKNWTSTCTMVLASCTPRVFLAALKAAISRDAVGRCRPRRAGRLLAAVRNGRCTTTWTARSPAAAGLLRPLDHRGQPVGGAAPKSRSSGSASCLPGRAAHGGGSEVDLQKNQLAGSRRWLGSWLGLWFVRKSLGCFGGLAPP